MFSQSVAGVHPTYGLVHRRARARIAGQPCAKCGGTERVQAALVPEPIGSILTCPRQGLRYSVAAEDYVPLCSGCHAAQDAALRRAAKCSDPERVERAIERRRARNQVAARRQYAAIKADPVAYAAHLARNRARAATRQAKDKRNAHLREVYARARAAGATAAEAKAARQRGGVA